MSYLDCYIYAVHKSAKEHFLRHANHIDPLLMALGATRIWECWGDDLPPGQVTDYRRAVRAEEDEIVVLSMVEWPDKASRDAGQNRLHELAKTDERFDEQKYPVPFDGKRMVIGGFEVLLEMSK